MSEQGQPQARNLNKEGAHMTITSAHTKTTQGFVPVTSYEHFWLNHLPIFIERQGNTIPVPAFIDLFVSGQARKLFLVGIDPGNSAAKYAMYSPQGHIVTLSVPAVVTQAKALATGDQLTTYQQIPHPSLLKEEARTAQGHEGLWNEEGAPPGEWIGEEAIRQDGTSLPTGSTRERMHDPRYAPFLMEGLIELFLKAGYSPGAYDLLGCWGARLEEMVETAQGPHLDPTTKLALDRTFVRHPWSFRRTDPFGRESLWRFTFYELVPGPQSLAGFHLWHKRPDGKAAQDLVHRVVELDFGAFDLHRLLIDCAPGRRVSARRERVGNGMSIELIQPFAQRLKDEYGIGELDDALVLHWLLAGQARVGGFLEDVNELVADVRARQIPGIIASAFKGQQRATDFYRMKGGGVLQMQQELQDKMRDLGRQPQTYLLVTDPTENAAGLLATLDLMVRGHGK